MGQTIHAVGSGSAEDQRQINPEGRQGLVGPDVVSCAKGPWVAVDVGVDAGRHSGIARRRGRADVVVAAGRRRNRMRRRQDRQAGGGEQPQEKTPDIHLALPRQAANGSRSYRFLRGFRTTRW